MSFTDFKEVSINNPGTASFYGSDDLNEIMRILNNKVVSNRRVRIANPWQFTDNVDVVAAAAVPANPGANTKRFYVDPADNHFKMKSSGGSILDFDVLGAGAQGEQNTASNIGTEGVGFWKQKIGVDLQFKKLNAGSSKVTITDDTANNEVDVDVTEANLLLQNIGGVLTVAKGGTGVGTHTTNGLLKGAGSGNITTVAPGTDGHILTMVSGAPAWASASASADVKTAVFEAGTQIGSVGRRVNFSNANDFVITENVGGDRFDISINRRWHLAASWFQPGSVAFPDLSTTYADAFTSEGDGVGFDIDANGMTDCRLYVSWNKAGFTGTHSVRVVRQTNVNDVLVEIPNCVNGRNILQVTIPAVFANQFFSAKLQVKSTIVGDNPILRIASIVLK